jgi:hypothetical protein
MPYMSTHRSTNRRRHNFRHARHMKYARKAGHIAAPATASVAEVPGLAPEGGADGIDRRNSVPPAS